MTDKEAMQMALETLDNMVKADWHEWDEFASVEDFVRWAKSRASFTAEALRARLAQPELAECDGGQCGIGGYCKQCPKTQHEPEPVAWGVPNTRPTEKAQFMMLLHSPDGCQYPEQIVPLYTTPPQREWVGMTHKERCELWNIASKFSPDAVIMHDYAREIEAALREKNA